jgi:hypothetical protein
MTGATMQLVTVDIRLAAGAPAPTPKLEDGEHIVTRLVDVTALQHVLRGKWRDCVCPASGF